MPSQGNLGYRERMMKEQRHGRLADGLVLGAIAVLLLAVFREGLAAMVYWWQEPEYTHGYLIPFLAAWLLFIRSEALAAVRPAPAGSGLVVMACGIAGFVVGELSSLYIIVNYALLLTLWGLAITLLGWRGAQTIWASLLFLLFMVPLPYFIRYNLTADLQFLSTEIGAQVLRLLGVPVHVEGNVIDMGVSKLQVVEACSGLRYLFPLMSMGYICGYLFRGPLWQRWLIFLSTIPITIVMNSVRIAITGIIYDRWGIGAGDEFLHFFEGWVIFVGCIALLFAEMTLFAVISRQRLDDVLDIALPTRADVRRFGALLNAGRPGRIALGMLLAALGISLALSNRTETIPAHQTLASFPLVLGDWRGREGAISPEELGKLRLTDYTMINYTSEMHLPVQIYVAYYDSQRKGASVHSPRACLPGGGWRIYSHDVAEVADVGPQGEALPVNRTLIGMGESRMMVYYWFMQRGRNITNEYLVKWFIFQDGITMRRTDGALVRLMVPLPDTTEARIAEADATLAAFLRVAYPRLAYHIPQRDAVARRE